MTRRPVLLPLVPRITAEIEAMAGGAASILSRGGMRTKIEAAKIATTGGTTMLIADGRVVHPVARLERGRAVHLVPVALQPGDRAKEMDRRSGRAARHAARRCRRGARDPGRQLAAARRGAPRGGGSFKRGDCVLIRTEAGEIGRGLVNYSSDKAALIAGRRSGEIERVLGAPGRAELIHRDDMVLAGD